MLSTVVHIHVEDNCEGRGKRTTAQAVVYRYATCPGAAYVNALRRKF